MLRVSVLGQDEDKEPVMELYLTTSSLNGIALKGRDASGAEWNLLWVGVDGIQMASGIPESTGWPVDGDGRLIVVNPKAE